MAKKARVFCVIVVLTPGGMRMKTKIIISVLMLLLVACDIKTEQDIVSKYRARVDSLIQERGHSWLDVNSTSPDSIYFISFGGDTTWYIKISN